MARNKKKYRVAFCSVYRIIWISQTIKGFKVTQLKVLRSPTPNVKIFYGPMAWDNNGTSPFFQTFSRLLIPITKVFCVLFVCFRPLGVCYYILRKHVTSWKKRNVLLCYDVWLEQIDLSKEKLRTCYLGSLTCYIATVYLDRGTWSVLLDFRENMIQVDNTSWKETKCVIVLRCLIGANVSQYGEVTCLLFIELHMLLLQSEQRHVECAIKF